MTKYLPYIAIAILILAALACSESTPQVKPPSDDSTAAPAAVEATETPSIGSSRNNPAPPGSEVTIDNMTFVVLDSTRPVDALVAEGNMFNPEPEAGNEYVMITISVTCEKAEDETCTIGPMWDMALVGSAGVTHDVEWAIAGVDGQLEQTEFYGGATASGSLIFEVGQGETDLVLRYQSLLGTSKAFLAVPEPGG